MIRELRAMLFESLVIHVVAAYGAEFPENTGQCVHQSTLMQLPPDSFKIKTTKAQKAFTQAASRTTLTEVSAEVAEHRQLATVNFTHGDKEYHYELERFSVYSDDYVEERHTSEGVLSIGKPEYSPTFKTRQAGRWASAWIDEDGSVSGVFEVDGRMMQVRPVEGASMFESDRLRAQTHTIEHMILPRMQGNTTKKEGEPGVAIDFDDAAQHWTYDASRSLPEEMMGSGAVGSFDPGWRGTRWFPGCYAGDDKLHVMKVGLATDVTAQKRYGASLRQKLEHVVLSSSIVYENQMHIELLIAVHIKFESDASAPAFAKSTICRNRDATDNQVMEDGLDSWTNYWSGTRSSKPAVAAAHLMTGCGGWGIMGIAYIGVLCHTSHNTGINKIWHHTSHNEWTTFAHELGHNFKGSHSFEEGQGKTGGIMDYGDGLLSGIYQFNTKYRKTEMCNHLKTAKQTACENKEIEVAPEKPAILRSDWWSSFDRKGWSEANGPIVGIYRNGCHDLYCLEEVKYANLALGGCSVENWWSKFDAAGMHVCPGGKFLTGIWRNDCHHLYCIEQVKCCHQQGRTTYAGGCAVANWWGSFDTKGYSWCPEGTAITGLRRNTCHELYCLEEVTCCHYSY